MKNNQAAPVMLIVGGSGSIGSEIATQAVACGWSIALHGRTQINIDNAVQRILRCTSNAIISSHCADFSNAQAIENLVAEVGNFYEHIDAIIDCSVSAPNGVIGLFEQTQPANYARLAEQSIVMFQRLAHAALPWLKKSRGSLVSMISDAGIYSAPGQAMIGAMRAANIGFVRNLAKELAREGIRVNAISPSYVEGTASVERLNASSHARMEKARARAGLGLPTREDIARLALFLAGGDSVRITGQIISINGGLNT